jgi:hypothetical protein
MYSDPAGCHLQVAFASRTSEPTDYKTSRDTLELGEMLFKPTPRLQGLDN